MVAFLKTGVISVVLQSSGTVLLLNAELMMIKVIQGQLQGQFCPTPGHVSSYWSEIIRQ